MHCAENGGLRCKSMTSIPSGKARHPVAPGDERGDYWLTFHNPQRVKARSVTHRQHRLMAGTIEKGRHATPT